MMNDNKNVLEKPKFKVTRFTQEDIIATSGPESYGIESQNLPKTENFNVFL